MDVNGEVEGELDRSRRNLKRLSWALFAAAAVCIGVSVFVLLPGKHFMPAVVGVVASALFVQGAEETRLELDRPKPRPFEARIDELTDALKRASATIEEIEREVRSRSLRAYELAGELERLQNLASIERREAQAVEQLVALELAKAGRRSRLEGLAINVMVAALFFWLGRV